MSEQKRKRERGENAGRYAYETDRACVCGHPLSVHTAERAKVDGKTWQPCIVGDLPGHDICECECFKPARRK